MNDRASWPALVFGNGVTPLGVMRALAHTGTPGFVVSNREDFVRRSRWYHAAPPRSEGMSLADYLEGLSIPRAVLVPCSDFWVSAVAALPRALRERFPASVPAPDVVGTLVDKLRFAEVLRRIGVPHPHTEAIDSVADLERIPESVLSDATFLKPRNSQQFFARFNVKAFRVASRADAVACLREIEAAGLSVVLQEYVPGPATRHYYVEGFVDVQGSVRIWFARQRLRMHPPDFGNSTYFVSVQLDEVQGAVASMRTLLEHLRYRGIFSAEFKRDDRDGEFKLLEVNARPWWYVNFAVRCGADVVQAYCRDAQGLPVETLKRYRVGATCMYPYLDYSACRGDRWSLPRFGRWIGELLGAQQPVFQWSDPWPAITLVTALGLAKCRRPLGTGSVR